MLMHEIDLTVAAMSVTAICCLKDKTHRERLLILLIYFNVTCIAHDTLLINTLLIGIDCLNSKLLNSVEFYVAQLPNRI